jgi:hypothetical protein
LLTADGIALIGDEICECLAGVEQSNLALHTANSGQRIASGTLDKSERNKESRGHCSPGYKS